MQFNKILHTGLFCALSFLSLAQNKENARLSGHIKSAQGEVLLGATILLKPASAGTTSDSDGFFVLKDLSPGNYELEISAVGFQKLQEKISLKSGESLTTDFILESAEKNLGEVLVFGKNDSQQLKEQAFSVNAIQTRQFANTTADLNQILTRSAGVNIREQGGLGSDFNFSINGLSGKQVKFFLDGVPMENFGSSMALNNIPVNLAERIEVFKGVVPVELGADALGGAVNIVTNQNTKRYLDASYSFGSFNTHRASVSGRITQEKSGLVLTLNAFYNTSANNFLMRNNPAYDLKIQVVEGEGNNLIYAQKNVKRFHDGFESKMIQAETGFMNKKWADVFLIGLTYSNQYKQIQTRASQDAVVGSADRKNNFFMPSVKFKKTDFLIKGLSTNIFASYASDKSVIADTSKSTFDWAGRRISNSNTGGELSDHFTIYHYTNQSFLGRANFSYKINESHALNLNYNFSAVNRKAFDDLDLTGRRNAFAKPNKIRKQVAGLAWQSEFMDKRLTNTVFGKFYGFDALVREVVIYTGGVGLITDDTKSAYNYFGYGFASRFKLNEQAGLKVSAEHAYRLQDAEEIFGDGINVMANLDLKPEKSDNFNAGAYFFKRVNKHNFSAEASWFLRNANDFIYYTPTQVRLAVYDNVGIVKINGVEGELKYGYNNLFSAVLNASYQNAKNNRKFQERTQLPDPTFGDKIPNQPYFFANAEFGAGKNNWLGKDTRIQLTWFGQYIHQYYLTWPSQGSKSTKNVIPSQLIHNLSLSYSLQNGRYNISLESRNLTNELAYDNFKLQKPGRAFYAKIRYFIQ
ncbi:TonB-dependent receptor [Dyadobacter psychrotolerans]|uniref:TonB-dependent receptor n=1 Tax=Dyadobacter psychrotolerans TaxID=2541721 RepID=A0A4R5DQJ3_9BACT|nr:TonB-dependent receptor [Dyadobacter psychrotolerans]TDE14450.1 TonB-dependent receptor [Dyadobacter psychrotolerans]